MFAKAFLILMIGAIGFQDKPQAAGPLPYTESEAYEVYSAILPKGEDVMNKFVIISETIPEVMCLSPVEGSKADIDAAIANYKKLNAKTRLLKRNFKIERAYELVPRARIESIFKYANGWQEFHEFYPRSSGYISLSAVGFNANKTIAIVGIGDFCGLNCGGEQLAVLEKKQGRWQLLKGKGSRCGWIS